MNTLIILTILFAIVIITLIIISIKKFNTELHYILIELDSLDDKITNINDENQKIVDSLNEKITSILNKTIKIDSRFITLHETIKDNLNNIEVAIKSLVNSINAIEEEQESIKQKVTDIDNATSTINIHGTTVDRKLIASIKEIINHVDSVKERNDFMMTMLESLKDFNNHHKRVTEMLDNKLIDAGIKRQDILTKLCTLDNIDSKVNAIVTEICSKTESIQIPDGFLDEITEYIGKKIIEIQAKNSLSANKVKKPSPAKSKHRTRAKKADNSYNSVQDTPQQNISEN